LLTRYQDQLANTRV